MNAVYSYKWLQSYFADSLPEVEKLVELLTNHSFEVEKTEALPSGDTKIELSILPNRAHDALGHFFLAKEIGVLIGKEPRLPVWKKLEISDSPSVESSILEEELCFRYCLQEVSGVKVGPSPDWLVEKLSVLGQRSINNLIDAGNFITFSVNQPVHIFDKDKLVGEISVRRAKEGEVFETLDGKTLTLDKEVLVIADSAGPVALAGIKGGKRAEVTNATNNIVIESASFDAGYVRKTTNRFNIKTDSSRRFEAELSLSLVPFATDLLLSLIAEVSGGTTHTRRDLYSKPAGPFKVGLPLYYPEQLLGFSLPEEKIKETIDRLGFSYREALSLKEILEMGPRLLGKPYVFGASVTKDAPNCFDCSSLVAHLYAEAGVWLPRLSVDQLVYGDPIEKESISAGDLVFSNSGQGKIHTVSVLCMPGTEVPFGVDHVGLYVGDGKVLHATRSAGTVVVEKLSESAQFKNVVAVRRYIKKDEVRLVVTIPDERLDLRLPEDLVEEIGRIAGYDQIPGLQMRAVKEIKEEGVFPFLSNIRNRLAEAGFNEVYGYAFSEKGQREVANPLQSDKPFLRDNLLSGLEEKLSSNLSWVDLFGTDRIFLFEVGAVFNKEREELHLALGAISRKKKEGPLCSAAINEAVEVLEKEFCLTLEKNKKTLTNGEAVEINLEPYLKTLLEKNWPLAAEANEIAKQFSPISPYPYIVRDVSFFLPKEMENDTLLDTLKKEAGPLCVRVFSFDRFLKEEGEKKTLSLGFRFVFQSAERTLTNEEVEKVFGAIIKKLESLGATIR